MTAPPTLSKVAFTSDSIRLPEVESFTCGTAIYETEISDWIKHPQNDKAIRFYRREGFLEYDEVFDFGFKNDVVYPAMIMKLKPAT